MTTTTTFKGVDPNSRNSSRVLRPPGGGSNFSLGFDEPTEQPVRKNKMASNIFGTPEENQASLAKSAGAKSSGGREDLESSGLQRRNSSEASSGDFLDLKGEGDIHVKRRNGYRNDFGVYILRNLRGRRSRKLRQRSLPDCRKCGHRLARQPEAE
ncbi:jupiter microtubule associated homolog 1 isoform X4 [Symphalangus syndactylus]|uniref:jupiter microtubule associated homolog 1 isoform X4 n=1 Tax=Symphalangus syndactylus TaxID=9590 RepID=UPI0024430627|nr:jupiter microtubule associated homolog 1 isoform X2 [Symphalangus syndactylus]